MNTTGRLPAPKKLVFQREMQTNNRVKSRGMCAGENKAGRKNWGVGQGFRVRNSFLKSIVFTEFQRCEAKTGIHIRGLTFLEYPA